MTEIVRFDHATAAAVQNTKATVYAAQSRLQKDIAQHVVDHGGYCDDLTFATAFFGGIDPDMNWGDSYENRRVAAAHTPDDFRVAQKLAETMRYRIFDPFMLSRDPSSPAIDDVGIIMPGTPGMENDVAYIIKPDEYRFEGRIAFMGLSKRRSYRPYDQHDIFTIRRGSRGEMQTWVLPPSRLDLAIIRNHITDGTSGLERIDEANAQIAVLQQQARDFIPSIAV